MCYRGLVVVVAVEGGVVTGFLEPGLCLSALKSRGFASAL
uniref:Uncharacterized protein n=1 Tax=Heterorhabditis bacteriophora TaxID=37862 RepID=A0A1I7WQ26_HETBA